MNRRKRIQAALDKWLKPLGLLWWEVTVEYYNDPDEVIRMFHRDDEETVVAARIYSDWRYGTIRLLINLPAFKGRDSEETERIIVHELCHALVSEMQTGGMDHEERVVSILTKAFFWVRGAGG